MRRIGLVVDHLRDDIKLIKGSGQTNDKARQDMRSITLKIETVTGELNRIRSHCRHEVQRLTTERPYGVYVKGDPITWA